MENKIFHGYCALVRNRFNIMDMNTWLSPFVRFFINLWNILRGKEICRYNHAVFFCEISGIIYVFQAVKKGFIKTHSIGEYLIEKDPKDLLILKPAFDFNLDAARSKTIELEGTPYDLAGTCFHQLVRQVSDERAWIGKTRQKAIRRLYCSEAVAYIYHCATGEKLFENYWLTDPEDLFESKLFERVNWEKI